jgi:hypothetical protein
MILPKTGRNQTTDYAPDYNERCTRSRRHSGCLRFIERVLNEMQVVFAGMPETRDFSFWAIAPLKKICKYVVGTNRIFLLTCLTIQRHKPEV